MKPFSRPGRFDNKFEKKRDARSDDHRPKVTPPLDPWIWGEHSVEACVDSNPENLLEIFVEKKAFPQLAKLCKKLQGHSLSYVEKLPRFLAEKRTQGIAAKIKKFPVESIEKFYEQKVAADAQVLVLDRIQDIQNFGAILRSAAALGAHSVIIGSREQAPVNGTVAQVSAGNLFKLQVYVCHQLPKTCEKLRELGFKVLALESGGADLEKVLQDSGPSPLAWILGAEEDGIQSAILKHADQKVGIPMNAGVESLNVSNSAAIALYEGFKKLKKTP